MDDFWDGLAKCSSNAERKKYLDAFRIQLQRLNTAMEHKNEIERDGEHEQQVKTKVLSLDQELALLLDDKHQQHLANAGIEFWTSLLKTMRGSFASMPRAKISFSFEVVATTHLIRAHSGCIGETVLFYREARRLVKEDNTRTNAASAARQLFSLLYACTCDATFSNWRVEIES